MRKGKSIRRITAASVALVTAAAMMPAYAGASDCLGEGTFDQGISIPWHIISSAPAEQAFQIKDGAFEVTIYNPGGKNRGGDSRWDLAFAHNRLHIEAGHHYKLHWEVEASDEGELRTYIGNEGDPNEEGVWQNNAESWNQGWNNIRISKGKNSFDCEFTALKTIEVATWRFEYGGAGPYQAMDCFPEGAKLTFDNLSLECVTCGSEYKNTKETPCLWDPSQDMGLKTPRSDVRLNQLGYYTLSEKYATYATAEEKSAVKFRVQKNGTDVYSGTGKITGYDKAAGEYCQILDFSEVRDPGTYTILVEDENVYTDPKTKEILNKNISCEFEISNDLYAGLLKDAMNYYYQNRSGMDIEEKYITSYNPHDKKSKLAHAAVHESDIACVQHEWRRSYGSSFDGEKKVKIDATGGWYTGSDFSKNVSEGAQAVWFLQNMYERSKQNGTEKRWNDDGEMSIPQTYSVGGKTVDCKGNPDLLDEARYELEWMFKLIVDPEKDDEWGKTCDGLVYNDVTDHRYIPLATKPYDYNESLSVVRIVHPPTYEATFSMIACAAQASRLWADSDPDFAKKCLDIAEKSWGKIMLLREKWDIDEGSYRRDPQFAMPVSYVGTGMSEGKMVQDDAYWAACELFATTGSENYYNYLKTYEGKRLHDKAFDIFRAAAAADEPGTHNYNESERLVAFDPEHTASMGTLSLLLSEKTSAEDKKTISDNITAAADRFLDKENESTNGMGTPFGIYGYTSGVGVPGEDFDGYESGSNYTCAGDAVIMAYAYDISNHDMKYLNGVTSAMDYIFGRNGLGLSYVTGYGSYHVNNPCNRYWQYEVDHDYPMAPSGVMVGGAATPIDYGTVDMYMKGLGISYKTAPQKSYADSIEAYRANEALPVYQAVFAWDLAFITEELGGMNIPHDVTTTTTTSVTTTSNVTTATTSYDGLPAVKTYGDANCDDRVELADAILIMQSLANPNKYGVGGTAERALTKQGAANADVDSSTKGLTGDDALRIQEYLLRMIPTLVPEA